MEQGLCHYCQLNPITGKRRKYCEQHSAQASLIWKRVHRRLWRNAGASTWLVDWKHKSADERKAYFRQYMREYRRRKKLGKNTEHATPAFTPVQELG